MDDQSPRLYTDLADWWPLLSAPAEYADEAVFYRDSLIATSERDVREVLELGSGGGNNACHLKHAFELTLVDRAPAMLAVSRRLNPQCRHLEGDMRTVEIRGRFDAVFIHDATAYITTRRDLEATLATAYRHCRPGGALLVVPDVVRETFAARTDQGGHDGADGRAMRWLEWVWDPDESDDTYLIEFAYLLRERESVRCVHERHTCGVFSQQQWLEELARAGFRRLRVLEVPVPDEERHIAFAGVR
jgi:SAM-dependent methyltransferase